MLSNPEHGWCNVKVGDFDGIASYLMDIPFNCLNSFITYFTKGNSINSIAITFDEEGTEFTVISSFGGTFVIIERDESPSLKCFYDIDIKQLAIELVEDLEKDFDKWIDFQCYDEPEEGRSEKLRLGINKLKQLVNQF